MPRQKNPHEGSQTPDVIADVWRARDNQKTKYPPSHDDQHSIERMVGISHIHSDYSVHPECDDMRDELVQAAAVLIATIERFDRMTKV